MRECLEDGLIVAEPEARLIPRNYHSVYWAVYSASGMLASTAQLTPCHGFRKYFENALDEAGVDHKRKMTIERHIAGTRAKYYTDRDMKS